MKTDVNSWYNGLSSQGLTLSSVILSEILPQGPEAIDSNAFDSIKRAWLEFRTKCDDFDNRPTKLDVRDWLMTLFCEGFGNLRSTEVQPANSDGSNISNRFKASLPSRSLIPDFVIRREGNTNRGRLLSMLLPPNVRMKGASKAGKVQRDLVLLLRHCRLEFGLLSNGHQIRLIRVTPEDVSWIQWDPSIWFEHAEGRKQLDGLNALLGKESIGQEAIGESRKDGIDRFRLQDACAQSRQRQSSLSAVVGEGVRQSVEKLVNQLNAASLNNPELLDNVLKGAVPRSDDERSALSSLHQAAVRIVMRMIVIFFAEARDLLPHRSSPTYRENYSLTRLLEQLEDSNSLHGDDVLNHTTQAWSRILSLFDLVHDGSHHEVVSIHAYGGELFRPGDNESTDNVISALAAFEDPKAALTDTMVLEVLRKLRRSKMKANINGKSTWVATTVDYSTMDTEFIGMVYEGLLDYELRRVHEDDGAMVTLRIGQQPMLPLSLLENQDDAQLSNLIKELSKNKDTSAPDIEDKNSKADSTETAELIEDDSPEDKHDAAALRALNWALRAVDSANLVKMPKGKKAAFADIDELKRERAEELLIQVHAPGDMFLVNYSGNRKGSGTFYTPPGLSIPTVRRTLEPLCYDVEEEETEDGLIRTLTPKTPQEILSLTVCDPAMGSGSFLVAALRYLTDALFTSLESHSHFAKIKSGTRITLPAGTVSSATESEDLLLHPDDARFEIECKARLKRYIAQRCIYGVDLNPMAVELGKMALWVETLSRDLPFEFLDHHIKCGNSLVGAWFDEFEHFPLAAFARDTGDSGKKHAAHVHHQPNTWRDLMKNHLKDLKDSSSAISVSSTIRAADGQRNLFNFNDEDPSKKRREALSNRRSGFVTLQKLSLHDPLAREEYFRTLQNDSNFQGLKLMMDTWCASWFWPPEKLQFAPKPAGFGELVGGMTRKIVEDISSSQRFFHWELEFPDVFTNNGAGFSTIIGNPPWNSLKPYVSNWFSRYDPLVRTKTAKQIEDYCNSLFNESAEIETSWVRHLDAHSSISHFIGNRKDPWGDGKLNSKTINIGPEPLRRKWSIQRSNTSYSNGHKTFQCIGGGEINLYKAFTEQFCKLLETGVGRFGIITPWSLFSDMNSTDLRRLLFIDQSIDIMFGFQNKNKIFDIHPQTRFGSVIGTNSPQCHITRASFMNDNLNNFDKMVESSVIYPIQTIINRDPDKLTIVETRTQSDVNILDMVESSGHKLLSPKSPYKSAVYRQEMNMTTCKDKFILRNPLEINNLPKTGVEELVALIEGRSISEYSPNAKSWKGGHGRGANWGENNYDCTDFCPQYLVNIKDVKAHLGCIPGTRIIFKDITSATNSRTFIGSLIHGNVGNNAVPTISFGEHSEEEMIILLSWFNSLICDHIFRMVVLGNHMIWNTLQNTVVPSLTEMEKKLIIEVIGPIATGHPNLSQINQKIGSPPKIDDDFERNIRLALCDYIWAQSIGLSIESIAHITRECGDWIPDSSKCDPTGFWRIDKNKPVNERRTVLFHKISKYFIKQELSHDKLDHYIDMLKRGNLDESINL